MANLNQINLMGYLGQDPEVRTMPDGSFVATFSLATSKAWTDKITGERRDKTEWHRIVVYQKLAEITKDYLKKGSNVFVQGELVYRKWEDKHGISHTTAEIRAELLQMLDGKAKSGNSQENQNQVTQAEPVGVKNDKETYDTLL